MSRLLSGVCLTLVVFFTDRAACQAQAFVEHLSPPALERGKTTRLTVAGSNLKKALDLWTTQPTGKITAAPVGDSKAEVAVFDVWVAEDAPVGLFGLRVATADGLSNVHLCLLDDLPVGAAPDSAKGPAKVKLPCALWGRFREGEVDRFAVEVKAAQRVSFEAVGNRFGKEVDPLVTIRDAKGRLVAERDNDPGLYFDCRFEHRFTDAGTYTVEMRDSRFHGHEHGFYVLRMGRFPAARVAVPAVVRPSKHADLFLPELNETLPFEISAAQHAGPLMIALRGPDDEGSTWLPVEVSDAETTIAAVDAVTAEKGTPAKVPGQLCGVLAKPRERQFFRLELTKGQAIQVVGHARWLNSPVDLDLAVTDATGKTLRTATEGADDTVKLDFTAPAAASYCLAVRDLARDGGPAYAYRLDVRGGTPQVEIFFEAPITFTARGGQLADKNEGRTRVYAEVPTATAKELKINGSVHSRILSNLGKTRIEVLASAVYEGRTITLIRTFELEIRTAFTVAAPPAPIKLAPGAAGKVRLTVERVKTFAGPVTVKLQSAAGLDLPETVVIPRGEMAVEIEVKAQKDATPGRRSVQLSGMADVDGFEEEYRGGRIEIEVPKPETPKK